MIIPLERFTDLIVGNKPSERASSYFEEITRIVNLNTPIKGTGSPEGVVMADEDQMYRDTTGSTGNILYIKNTGSGDTGWILL